MLVLQVFIMRNGAFEGTEMVTGSQIEIGRDPSCSMCLDDDGVSRKHALLFEHNGQLALRDLGSANGTRVNGEPVSGARTIGPRDDIAIGAFTLKVKVMSGQARAATPSAPPIIQGGDPTRVLQSPSAASSSGPSSRSPKPLVIGDISSADERTEIAAPKDPRGPSRPVPAIHMAATEAVSPIGGYSGEGDAPTNTQPSPPPVPPHSDEERPTRPVINTRGALNNPAPSPAPLPWAPAGSAGAVHHAGPDVTAPNAELPRPRGASAPSPSAPPVQPGLAARPSPAELALDGPIPDVAINSDGAEIKAIHFEPRFLEDELEDDDADDPPWSLVQQLVRPSQE